MDDADRASAADEVARMSHHRATAGAVTTSTCLTCDRPLEPFDRRQNPNAATCTRCRKAGAR